MFLSFWWKGDFSLVSDVDAKVVIGLHNWVAGNPVAAYLATGIAEYGLILLPVALVLLWLRGRTDRASLGMTVTVSFAAAAVAFGLGFVLEHLLSRPRPFLALDFLPLLPHVADSSFPSDHTLVGAALVGLLVLRWPRVGVWLFAWVLLIGVARIAVGVHYPSDIGGSALLGLAIDLLVWVAVIYGLRWLVRLRPRATALPAHRG
jgi:undecaprenyl-diphosphatase